MTVLRRTCLAAYVTHARDVRVDVRDAFARTLEEIAGHDNRPMVVLSTCHRVEAYLVDDPDRTAERPAELALPAGGHLLTGEDAVRHVIAVATGRDSVVLGEDQILHQVRVALESARVARRLDPSLERLLTDALRAGRRARSWDRGADRSLADLAVSSVVAALGSLQGRRVLIVGAGRMGTLAGRAAVRAGASVTVANRTAGTAGALAASLGGRVAPGDAVAATAPDAVIVAIAGQWSVTAEGRRVLGERGTVVVDLSVPPAVDPDLAAALADRLITADALAQRTAPAEAGASAWSRRADALVEATTRAYLAWLDRADGRAAARALATRAERDRQEALEHLWSQRPALAPEDRQAIDGMTRHLADRLLAPPLERLGRDPDGEDSRIVRELFAL